MIELIESASNAEWVEKISLNFIRWYNDESQLEIRKKRRLRIALAGGTSPEPFYRELRNLVPSFEEVSFWIGDERDVPTEHDERNEKMVLNSLGGHENLEINGWSTHLGPESAVRDFESRLSAYDGAKETPFDLVLLGLGTDGHTASLFPGCSALLDNNHFAAATYIPTLGSWRLTITLKAINLCPHVWFLVRSEGRKRVIKLIIERNQDIPAARITVADQKIFVLGNKI